LACTAISTHLKKRVKHHKATANFRLSHIAFGIPVSKRSAISFGLMPYSELGYNYKQISPNFGTGFRQIQVP
jgi:hypothetical protein